jgi:CO/xanthine dehydrogenase Mo-binding subunit
MATQLGLDPAAVRRQNLVQPHTETINGLRITSVGLAACLDQVLAASGYSEKRGRLGPHRGIGLACSAYMCGALHPPTASDLPQSGVVLTADRSGRVAIFSGTADVGQGSNQMLVTLVAERLGLPRSLLSVVEADTDLTPVDLGSYSSRVTFMAGNAALQAADRLRALVFGAAAAQLRCEPRDLLAADGLIVHRDAPERRLSWVEAVALAEARHGTLSVSGSYTPPKIGSRFRRQSVGPSPAYSFTAVVTELQVDPETGEVRVERIWCAHDLGRVLNPEIARGQIEGCVYMGLGEALFEEQRYRGPAVMAPSILEYRIPTAIDTPPIEVIFVESHDPEGPFGAKEVGEGPQLAVVPAIANAMYDATGLWWERPPFTPERVARGLRRARSGP